jgi:methionine-rich copper-binding protein CopC
VIAALLALASTAGAHAFLERAEPRHGSTVREAPSAVKLYFTERLEPAYSSARVIDARGVTVDRGKGGVDRENRAMLRVPVPSLPPGAYRVLWRVLSVDAHITEGQVTFRVSGR